MPIFRKSVSGIVADIQKKVEELHGAREHHTSQMDAHNQKAYEHQDLAVKHSVESGRALSIAERLTALIS